MRQPIFIQVSCVLTFAVLLWGAASAPGAPMAYPTLDFGGGPITPPVPPDAGRSTAPSQEPFAAAVERAAGERVATLLEGSALLTLPRPGTDAARDSGTSRSPAWLAQLFASDKAETRLRGVELCVKNFTPACLDYLTSALSDPDATVRERASAALAESGEDVLVERVLLSLSAPESTALIAEHLPALRDQLAPGLRELLADESEPAARRHLAALGLGAMGDRESADALGAWAQQGEYPMAHVCARALLALRAPEALPHWLALSTHADEQLRATALAGLAEDGGAQAFARLLEVAAGGGQSSPWLQVAAVRYIGEQPVKSAVPALVHVMEKNAWARQEAGALLTKMTGWELGNDPALWRAWLENPRLFMPPPGEGAEEQAPAMVKQSPLETLGTF